MVVPGGAGAHPRYSLGGWRRSRRRRLLAWTLAAAALPVVSLGCAYLLAAGWLRWERRAWIRDQPAGAEALGRLRRADADATARRLIELARPLGIELGVLPIERDRPPAGGHVRGRREAAWSTDDDRDVPLAVRDRLLREGARLDAIEELLAALRSARLALRSALVPRDRRADPRAARPERAAARPGDRTGPCRRSRRSRAGAARIRSPRRQRARAAGGARPAGRRLR